MQRRIILNVDFFHPNVLDYSIILVQPSRPQNVGSICRLSRNFGNPNLIIVNNEADLTSDDFMKTARHAKNMVSDIIHHKSLKDALKNNITYAIAMTARQTSTTTSRITFPPSDIPWNEVGSHPALVFGSESYGLSKDDVSLCDFLVTIPTNETYSSLNLSHAVAIMCYELFTSCTNSSNEINQYEPASFILKQKLEQSFSRYANTFLKKPHVSMEIFHNLIARSRITEGEASNLIGALKAWEFHFNQLQDN